MLLKKIDTYYFYKLGWKKFLQPSLMENYVQFGLGNFEALAEDPNPSSRDRGHSDARVKI